MLIAIELRALTLGSLDEVTEAVNPLEPEKIRSAIYRTFVREGINKVPEKEKEKAKKLKNTPLDFFILTLLICLK